MGKRREWRRGTFATVERSGSGSHLFDVRLFFVKEFEHRGAGVDVGRIVRQSQALTRARVCAGDAGLAARFERLRGEILSRPRDLERLRADVLSMRRKMHEGHPNRSALFDLKHDAGGMVDVEFIVQTLVLGHADRYSRLLGNAGNIALLLLASQHMEPG